ncbi:MAG: hypothetical protein HYX93_05255 [Chloroflexi bacterium]|nr:hypothetical protein [Chloroflexota bacterium]
MPEEAEQSQGTPSTQPRGQDEPIGGEVHVRGGAAPRFMRWLTYVLFVWAILYLGVHPVVEHRLILWIAAGLMTAWLLFFALAKHPPDP